MLKEKFRIRIKRGIKNLFFLSLFRFFYILGITLLIPFIFSLALEPQNIWQAPINLIIESSILISIGFFGLFWREQNLGKTLRFIGFATLIPAFISLFLFLFGEQLILIYLKNIHHLPFEEETFSFLKFYIEKTIPKFGLLTIGYLLFGFLFYFTGRKIKR